MKENLNKKLKKNADCWIRRAEILQESLLKKGDAFNAKIGKEYEKAANAIQKEIESFYFRFAKENEISLAEAKKILTTAERKAFQMTLEEYIEKGKTLNFSNEYAKVLENASTVHRISRLQALQLQMRQHVEVLISELDKGLTDTLKEIYTDGYYGQIFNIQQGTELGVNFSILDTKTVNNVILKPWTASNETFKDSIWKDKTKLLNYLDTHLAQSLIRGQPPQKIISDMVKKMGGARSNAARLVLTESAFFVSKATEDSYKAMDVKQYKIVATLDSRTSELCAGLDGKIVEREDYRVGATAPPFHPYCRTTTAPYFPPDEFDLTVGERAAKGSDGKYYTVPANIKYHDWLKKYVKTA